MSGKSSSSGSYSIGGSIPNVTDNIGDKTLIEKEPESLERPDFKKKEEKVTSAIGETEQLVPKMTVKTH